MYPLTKEVAMVAQLFAAGARRHFVDGLFPDADLNSDAANHG